MMKNFRKHITLAAAIILSATACEKQDTPDNVLANTPIIIGASEAGTKALLDNGTFSATGNRLIIYDYVDDSTEPYFVDQIGPDVEGSPLANSMKPQGVWPFVNGPHQWTPGKHNFFGWLVNDSNGTEDDPSDDLTPVSLFGNDFSLVFDNTTKKYSVAAFDEKSRTLTIPEITMDQNSPQFDFMYSDIVSTDPKNDPVNLQFQHLFTAFRITALNDTEDVIIVDSISIDGWKNRNSATIVFNTSSQNDGSIAVSYNSGDEACPGIYTNENESEDADPDKYIPEFKFDFINGTVGVTIDGTMKNLTAYYLTWPHFNTSGSDEKNLRLKIVYLYNGVLKTKKLDLPNFQAGRKYDINLKFKIDEITFKIKELERWGTLIDGDNDITYDDGNDIIEEL